MQYVGQRDIINNNVPLIFKVRDIICFRKQIYVPKSERERQREQEQERDESGKGKEKGTGKGTGNLSAHIRYRNTGIHHIQFSSSFVHQNRLAVSICIVFIKTWPIRRVSMMTVFRWHLSFYQHYRNSGPFLLSSCVYFLLKRVIPGYLYPGMAMAGAYP